MVAQVNHEIFSEGLVTPGSAPADSEEVSRALATARECETRGDLREAVRWLRIAANAAETQGDDARVLALARAAADLTNRVAPVSLAAPSPAPSVAPPAPESSVDRVAAERRMRIGSVRVAFAGSMQEGSFMVHRLAVGERAPEDMTEAILVLTGGVEGRVEIETTLRVVERAPKP